MRVAVRLRSALLAVVLMYSADAAARMQMTVEFGPGVTIPLGRYVDQKSDDAHWRIDSGVHGALNLAVLFGNWSFRYGVSWVSMGRTELRLPESTFQELNSLLAQTGSEQLTSRDFSYDADDDMAFHTLTFGYRFYLARGTWQPYIPLEVGAVVVSSDSFSRDLSGATAVTGLGLDVKLWKFFYVGACARYHFLIGETESQIAGLGIMNSGDVWDSAVSIGHLIALTAHIQARY